MTTQGKINGDKTMSKPDKDYVYDSLVDAQGIIDDLVEYMEDDDIYEEDGWSWRSFWEELCEFIFLFWWWVVIWIVLQATFTLIKQL